MATSALPLIRTLLALQGYSHVDPACFASSPTALLYKRLMASGGMFQAGGSTLEAAHELRADYDGLGVRWGIGHKKQTWEVCSAL